MCACQIQNIALLAAGKQTRMSKRTIHPDFKVLVGMAVVLVVPFTITLLTVKEPRPLITDLAANPTPYGYTLSLTLFFLPMAVLAVWQSLRKENPIQKRAFW